MARTLSARAVTRSAIPFSFISILMAVAPAACSSDKAAPEPAEGGTSPGPSAESDAASEAGVALVAGSTAPQDVPASDANTPPTTAAAVVAWLAQGSYKTGSWTCESAPHAARSPSPHGTNRICSNATLSGAARAFLGADATPAFSPDAGAIDWPVGTAAVKELYDSSGANVVGYAVYLKAAASSAGGANWYWYEQLPPATAASFGLQYTSTGVVADGFGAAGQPQTVCVGCHGAAGSDAAHTPSAGGGDEVYTPVF